MSMFDKVSNALQQVSKVERLLGGLGVNLGGLGLGLSGLRFTNTKTPMYGGISPADAKRIYQQSVDLDLVKKNLFVFEVSSQLSGDISEKFNLLAIECSYAPTTVTAEQTKIGSATLDRVHTPEPVALSITVLDEKDDFIKSWFNKHAQAAVNSDGTVGVPNDYAIKIKIVHGVIVNAGNGGNGSYQDSGYQDSGFFRPTNMDISLSRREDGLQELTLTFAQLDTFMTGFLSSLA